MPQASEHGRDGPPPDRPPMTQHDRDSRPPRDRRTAGMRERLVTRLVLMRAETGARPPGGAAAVRSAAGVHHSLSGLGEGGTLQRSRSRAEAVLPDADGRRFAPLRVSALISLARRGRGASRGDAPQARPPPSHRHAPSRAARAPVPASPCQTTAFRSPGPPRRKGSPHPGSGCETGMSPASRTGGQDHLASLSMDVASAHIPPSPAR